MIPCTFQSGMENIFPCFSPCFHNFNTFALYNKGMVREMRQAENTPQIGFKPFSSLSFLLCTRCRQPPITDYIPLTMQALSCKVFNDYNACEFDL
mgnify:CR=1 FL=1